MFTKRLIVASTIFCLNTLTLDAQDTTFTFLRLYPWPGMSGTLAGTIAPDGTILMTGQFDGNNLPGGKHCELFITRVSPCGEILWNRMWVDTFSTGAEDLVMLSKTTFACIGRGYALKTFNNDTKISIYTPFLSIHNLSDGFMTRLTRFFSPHHSAFLLRRMIYDTLRNRLVAVGLSRDTIQHKNYHVMIIAFDTMGNIIWAWRYHSGDNTLKHVFGRDIVLLDDGYLITGGVNWGDVLVFKVDTNGNVQWVRTYGHSKNEVNGAMEMIYDPTSGMAFIGSRTNSPALTLSGTDSTYDALLLAIKADSGQLVRARVWGTAGFHDYFEGVFLDIDNNLVITGVMDTAAKPKAGGYYAFILKMDTSFNPMWSRRFDLNGGKRDHVTHIFDHKNGYIFLAHSERPNFSFDAMVGRMDKQTGYMSCFIDTLSIPFIDVTDSIIISSIPLIKETINITYPNRYWYDTLLLMPDSFLCASCGTDTPEVRFSPAPEVCVGDTLAIFMDSLPASSCTDIFWNSNLLTDDSVLINPPRPGADTLLIFVYCGNSMDTFQWLITYHENPHITPIADTSLCKYDSLLITPQVQGGTGNYAYSWTYHPNSANVWLSCDTCPTVHIASWDSIVVVLHVTDTVTSCATLDTFIITHWAPMLDLPDTVLCFGDSLLLNTGYTPLWEHTWQLIPNNGTFSCDTCPATTLRPSDSVLVVIRVSLRPTCFAVDSIRVGVIGPFNPILSSDTTLCEYDTLTLYAGSWSSYQWFPAQAVSCDTCPTTSIIITDTQVITLIVTDQWGCQWLDTLKVHPEPKPYGFISAPQKICEGDTAWINVESPFNYFILINNKDTVWGTSGTMSIPIYTQNPSVIPVTFHVQSIKYCRDTTLNSLITVVPFPAVTLYPSDTAVFTGDTITIYSITTTADAWDWRGTYILNTFSKDSIQILAVDTSQYILILHNEPGCVIADTAIIYTLAPPECTNDAVFVPNVFTPNGDGINDKLHVFSLNQHVKVHYFQIRNRWGQLLWQAENLTFDDYARSNQAWDGTFQGEMMKPDVFVYYLFYTCNEKKFFKKGDVTLIR